MSVIGPKFAGASVSARAMPAGLNSLQLITCCFRQVLTAIRFAGAWLKALLYAFLIRPRVANRYAVGALFSALLCCSSAAAYYFLSAPVYKSKWSLILPTASGGVSMQLETIGNAQTIPSSPFGSVSLSPKVIYKEIADSETVRRAAATTLGMSTDAFGRPRIKLIDETSIMLFEISGSEPGQARSKALALINALNKQLDSLREDEIARRAKVVENSLKSYRANLQEARGRILSHQERTGVLSINQFNEASTTLELKRRRLSELQSELDSMVSAYASLVAQMGIDAKLASIALKVAADPTFVKLAADYADANAMLSQESAKLGPSNPLLQNIQKRAGATAGNLIDALEHYDITSEADVQRIIPMMNGTQRSSLLSELVNADMRIAGKKKELETLESQITASSGTIRNMSADAAQLEDFNKSHLVAEAVFTSALARIDTNKVDVYASYPMIQIPADPDLPESPSSPNAVIAIAGALIGTILSLMAWAMAWVRHIFTQKRSKSA